MTTEPKPATDYFVEIVEMAHDDQPEKVHKRMGPMGERQAERVFNGANINLNHEQFFTRWVEEERKPEPTK